MKKLLIIPAALAALMAMASPASAHTPTITAKCESLSIDLKWYEEGSTVTVTIDGESKSTKFGPDWSGEFTGQQSWSVVVDNNGPKKDKYDLERSGTFEDCTPATTTTQPVPTTTAPVETPFDVTVTQTVAYFDHDCDTQSAWVQFVNGGTKADRVSVGGQEVDVPAGGFARVNLFNLGGYRFTFGPVASFVNNAPVPVTFAPEIDGTGAVSVVCIDTVVQTRQVIEQPQTLAFTGPGRTGALSALAALLIFVGAMTLMLARKLV